jgi:hypothetical protein
MGLLAVSQTSGVPTDSLLAVVATLFTGLAGPDTSIQDSLGSCRLPPSSTPALGHHECVSFRIDAHGEVQWILRRVVGFWNANSSMCVNKSNRRAVKKAVVPNAVIAGKARPP